MNKFVIFDAMGVIYKTSDDVKDLLYPYLLSLDKSISYDEVKSLYLKLSLGNITALDFFSKLGFSKDYPRIESEYLDSCLELDEGFKPLANKLSKKYTLAMLSNDASKWSKYLRQRYGLNKYLKKTIISADVGLRKPSRDIYEKALSMLDCDAKNCIFIDDNVINLISAKAVGMNVIWFNRNNDDTIFDGPCVRSMYELSDAIESVF